MAYSNLLISSYLDISHFLEPNLSKGSYLITPVRPSVGLWFVVEYLRDRSLVFFIFLHEVRVP